eukprot:238304-Rhodomonas_salina.1
MLSGAPRQLGCDETVAGVWRILSDGRDDRRDRAAQDLRREARSIPRVSRQGRGGATVPGMRTATC